MPTKNKTSHQMAKDVKCKPNTGGGPVRCEQSTTRSTDEIYYRMIARGELRQANKSKHTRIDKARAQALMKTANEAPAYLSEKKLLELSKAITKLDKNLKNDKIKNKLNEDIENIKKQAVKDYEKENAKTIKPEVPNNE